MDGPCREVIAILIASAKWGVGGGLQGGGDGGLVVVDTVLSLSITPSAVPGNVAATGLIRLTQTVPVGQTFTVNLSSDSTSAKVPKSVAVLGGNTAAQFRIQTFSVSEPTTVHITASAAGGSCTMPLTINPMTVKSISITPSTIFGGSSQKVTGKVVVDAKSSQDTAIDLSSSSSSVIVPSTVTILAGKKTASFTVNHKLVPSEQSVTITASLHGRGVSTTVIVKPVLAKISIPSSVIAGNVIQGTITTGYDAPYDGFTIDLSGSSTNATFSPPSPSIPSGERLTTFDLQAKDDISVTESFVISASFNGQVPPKAIRLIPIQIQSLSISPTSVKGGTKAALTISLNSNHIGRPVWVNINVVGNGASAPTLLKFSAGESSKTVHVSTSAVTRTTTVIVTTKLNDSKKVAKLTVTQ